MQTFLPYTDFQVSLQSLDNKRLGKQRVEAYQLISALTLRPKLDGSPYKGWLNHPCTIMWRQYIDALKLYYNTSIDVWVNRGFKNTMVKENLPDKILIPHWIGFEPFHSSHRSNLLSKDFTFYSTHNWDDELNQPYVWLSDTNRWYRQSSGQKNRIWI